MSWRKRFTCFSTILIAIVFLSLSTLSEAADPWIAIYRVQDAYSDQGQSLVQTQDNGYVVAGSTNAGQGKRDILLFKVNEKGFVDWSLSSGNDNDDEYPTIIRDTKDGGYIATGIHYQSTPHSLRSVWVYKLNVWGMVK
jgi:hypothetical protein